MKRKTKSKPENSEKSTESAAANANKRFGIDVSSNANRAKRLAAVKYLKSVLSTIDDGPFKEWFGHVTDSLETRTG